MLIWYSTTEPTPLSADRLFDKICTHEIPNGDSMPSCQHGDTLLRAAGEGGSFLFWLFGSYRIYDLAASKKGGLEYIAKGEWEKVGARK